MPIFAEFDIDVDVKGSSTPEPLLVEVLSRLDLFLFRILFLPMLMKRRCCYYDTASKILLVGCCAKIVFRGVSKSAVVVGEE